MRRRLTIGCALTGSLLLWACSARSTDDDASLKDKVLKAYPDALNALETRFGKAFGSVNGTEEHRLGKPTQIRIGGRFTFASSGPHLAKVTRLAAGTAMNNQKSLTPRETVFCFNRENTFCLVKEEGKPNFTIKLLATNKAEHAFIKNQMEFWLYSYLHAPFSLGSLSMNTVIADGGSAIQRVSLVPRVDKPLLKIEFDFKKGQNQHLRDFAGWVLVAPEEKWVIHEFEHTAAGHVYHGRVEYAQPQNGFPVPKRVVSTRMPLGGRQPTDSETYDFKELRFGDVPASEFRLSAFGLVDAPSP